jgi:hypothetical protein
VLVAASRQRGRLRLRRVLLVSVVENLAVVSTSPIPPTPSVAVIL